MDTKVNAPSYKEGLEELRGNLSQMLPAEALATFDADAEALQETHQSILKLNVGDKAPDFSLSNAVGSTLKLSEILKTGKVVLTFYRGTWCPYCNLQLAQYQQILSEINEAGAQLVAVSPQTPDESLNIKEKNDLEFEVLSDNGNIVAKRFTTVFKNGEVPISAMKDLGIDFGSFYGDDSNEIPVPAVFILDQDGTVIFAKSEGGDYRNRVETEEILSLL